MIFLIFRANALIAKYVEQGSMVTLVCCSVQRKTIAITQALHLLACLLLMMLYITIVEIVSAEIYFPNVLPIGSLCLLNLGLFAVQFFISAFCFFFSCVCNDGKYSIGFSGGICALMYVLQMIANMGGVGEPAKYFTFFTLFQPQELCNSSVPAFALWGLLLLFVGGIALYIASIRVFVKKDLPI